MPNPIVLSVAQRDLLLAATAWAATRVLKALREHLAGLPVEEGPDGLAVRCLLHGEGARVLSARLSMLSGSSDESVDRGAVNELIELLAPHADGRMTQGVTP